MPITRQIIFNMFGFSNFKFNPISLDPLFYFNADSLPATGVLDVWADKGKNGFNVSQASAVARPTVINNRINGHSVVRFSGGFMDFSIGPNTRTHTTFVVVKSLIPSSGQLNYATVIITASGQRVYWKLGTDNWGTFAGADITGGILLQENNYILETNCNGVNSSQLYVNGIFVNSVAGAESASATNCIGADPTAGGRNFIGDIADIITYPRLLSSNERDIVNAYLKSQYIIF